MTTNTLALFLVLVCACTAHANLLHNSDFENPIFRTGWTGADVALATSCAEGSQCARVPSGATLSQSVSLLTHRDLIDSHHGAYSVRAMVLVAEGARGHIELVEKDSSLQHVINTRTIHLDVAAGNWVEVASTNRQVLRGAREVELRVVAEAGQVTVDAVALDVVEAAGVDDCAVGEATERFAASAYGRPVFPSADNVEVTASEPTSGWIHVEATFPYVSGGHTFISFEPQTALANGGDLDLTPFDSLDRTRWNLVAWEDKCGMAVSACAERDVRTPLVNTALGWRAVAHTDRTAGLTLDRSIFSLVETRNNAGEKVFSVRTDQSTGSFFIEGKAYLVVIIPLDLDDASKGFAARSVPISISAQYASEVEITTTVSNVLTDRSLVSTSLDGRVSISVSLRGEALDEWAVDDMEVSDDSVPLRPADTPRVDKTGEEGGEREVIFNFVSTHLHFADIPQPLEATFHANMVERGDVDNVQLLQVTLKTQYTAWNLLVKGRLHVQMHLCTDNYTDTTVVSSEDAYNLRLSFHEPVAEGTFVLQEVVMTDQDDGTAYHVVEFGEITLGAGVDAQAAFLPRADYQPLEVAVLRFFPGLVASANGGTFTLSILIHIDASIFESTRRGLEADGWHVRDGGVVQDSLREMYVSTGLEVLRKEGNGSTVSAASTLLAGGAVVAALCMM